MFSKLKAAWTSLAGPRSDEPAAAAVEYKGYRIRPTPYLSGSQYQTAGSIEKDSAEGMKTHAFVRADTHALRADAIAFTINKARQLIDMQGDQLFG